MVSGNGEANSNRSFGLDDLPKISGMATLLNAPYQENLENTDIALIGVPFDGGVVFRPGARFGPAEVRNKSGMIGRMNHQTKIEPFGRCRIRDVGDVSLESIYHLESAVDEIEQYFLRIVSQGVLPVSVGGDHSISYPILKAVGSKEPVGLIHFDAHCDTGDAAYNSKFHHGGPFKNAVEAGVLDPTRTIQIGIRGTAEKNWAFSYASGMQVLHIEDFKKIGIEGTIEQIRRTVGDGPTYLSFDVDCLDPAYAPGTGTPEVGGMTSFEAQQVLRGLGGLSLVGADLVEVAPTYDQSGITALLGANLVFEQACLLAQSF